VTGLKTRIAILCAALCGCVLGLERRVSGELPEDENGTVLRMNSSRVHFVDIARQAGITMKNVNGGDTRKEFIIETTGSGAVIFDYDHDGWPDIFLPNGSTIEGFPGAPAPTGHLYHNNHDGTFTDVTKQAGLTRAGWGQGACVGDYDNDGNLDFFETSTRTSMAAAIFSGSK
jgi:hypothetical protein